jgi:hypothetical protein
MQGGTNTSRRAVDSEQDRLPISAESRPRPYRPPPLHRGHGTYRCPDVGRERHGEVSLTGPANRRPRGWRFKCPNLGWRNREWPKSGYWSRSYYRLNGYTGIYGAVERTRPHIANPIVIEMSYGSIHVVGIESLLEMLKAAS